MVIKRLTSAVAAFVVVSALGGCSGPAEGPSVKDPLLKDPARWPLAGLEALTVRTGQRELPEQAERTLAQIRVGSVDLTAWINSSGLCGLTGPGWSIYADLTRSDAGDPAREDGFSGPEEPEVGSSNEGKVGLFCTPTRMLIRVEGETSKPSVSGHAVAQVFNGGLNVVVGTREAQRESLPGATVTPGR
ncbi:hypothetical protein [Nonomuraea rhodomycinica]|uniref:Lipoprotein n=1 Tax=Nonomuraea rhodomycinica TaxID=1712872 RepID=A0A7Y6ITM6_9ACTN|nr:hypothetical protein [Nonomuraea rhodomycinica]NUW43896.1 hypothetical protein [Nonomuraea rhodomycinica]